MTNLIISRQLGQPISKTAAVGCGQHRSKVLRREPVMCMRSKAVLILILIVLCPHFQFPVDSFYSKSYSAPLSYNNPVTPGPCFLNAGSGVVFQRVHSVPCWLPLNALHNSAPPLSFSSTLSFSSLLLSLHLNSLTPPFSLLLFFPFLLPPPPFSSLLSLLSSCRLTQWPTKRLVYLTSPHVRSVPALLIYLSAYISAYWFYVG